MFSDQDSGRRPFKQIKVTQKHRLRMTLSIDHILCYLQFYRKILLSYWVSPRRKKNGIPKMELEHFCETLKLFQIGLKTSLPPSPNSPDHFCPDFSLPKYCWISMKFGIDVPGILFKFFGTPSCSLSRGKIVPIFTFHW